MPHFAVGIKLKEQILYNLKLHEESSKHWGHFGHIGVLLYLVKLIYNEMKITLYGNQRNSPLPQELSSGTYTF